MQRKTVAILASGTGTTFQSILDSSRRGDLIADIAVLASDRKDCGAVLRAESAAIPVLHLLTKHQDEAIRSLERIFSEYSPDIAVLAGYNRILPAEFVERHRERIINTHPALLPCFGGKGMYGLNVHRAVIVSGAKFSGCTVHFVDTGVDTGPIIAQAIVQVSDNDTPESLSEKVKAIEKPLLISTISRLLYDPYRIEGKRVMFT
ncbi:MAG: phosphoribosylglycinamide formyltransferase [Candidatus Thermoplasmatota archaeon]|jgi:phosphoribosylglycinamide formyltransferase-1|nr:phosphoribosylglycinamide formyltransferase [Candidatus Thermoplasmatota archaeon]